MPDRFAVKKDCCHEGRYGGRKAGRQDRDQSVL
jgi:hypothetical protein